MSWREHAACIGSDPGLFDEAPAVGRNGVLAPKDRERVLTAMRVCATCPVAADCYADALEHDDSHVRGGVMLRNTFDGRPIVKVTRAQLERQAEGRRKPGPKPAPRPSHCGGCQRPVTATRTAGSVQYHARGLCHSCYVTDTRQKTSA